MNQQFKITFSDLWATSSEDLEIRLPISEMENIHEHIHGHLTIEMFGKVVPHIWFFEPDDVCMNDWFSFLLACSERLKTVGSICTFDEGEQGQPAFVFERTESAVLFSIADSKVNGEVGDPDWDSIEIEYQLFNEVVQQFVIDFKELIEKTGNEISIRWLNEISKNKNWFES